MNMDINLTNIEIAKFAFDLIDDSLKDKENKIFNDMEKLGIIKLFETIFLELYRYKFYFIDQKQIIELNNNLNPQKALKKHKFSTFMIHHIFSESVYEYYDIFKEVINKLMEEIKKFNINYEELLVLRMFLSEFEETKVFLYRNIKLNNSHTINLVVNTNPKEILSVINKSNYFKYFFSVISLNEFQEISNILEKNIQKIYLN